jgi:hypothetical protein
MLGVGMLGVAYIYIYMLSFLMLSIVLSYSYAECYCAKYCTLHFLFYMPSVIILSFDCYTGCHYAKCCYIMQDI